MTDNIEKRINNIEVLNGTMAYVGVSCVVASVFTPIVWVLFAACVSVFVSGKYRVSVLDQQSLSINL